MTFRTVLAREAPFAIGPLMVSPSTLTVSRQGREKLLEPRVMQVLVALARTQGAVVSRDDLLASCWEGRVVGDDAINRVLGRLRRLAQDLGEDLFTIETITRVGYRLVRLPLAEAETAPFASAERGMRAPGASPVTTRRRVLGAGLAATGLAAAGATAWLLRARQQPSRAARQAMDAGLAALRQLTPDQVSEAVVFFRKAASLAPDLARPWALLALAYQSATTMGAPPDRAPLLVTRAREAARRALAIEPDNADAEAAIAALRPIFRNWLDAGSAIDAVMVRHPDGFSINRLAPDFYCQVGHIHRVQASAHKALAKDAQWPALQQDMILSNWVLGRLEEADAWVAQAFGQWPRHYAVWFTRQRLLSYTGRAAQALDMIEDVANRPIGIPDWNFDQCRLEAQALLSRASKDIDAAARGYEAEARRGVGFAENAAQFFSEMGMVDKAFDLLGALYYGRSVTMPDQRYSIEQGQYMSRRERNTWILWMPMSASLRQDRRLLPILRDIGLVDYWSRTGTRPDVDVAGL